MSKKYVIENKIFQEIYRKSENVINSLVVLEKFCKFDDGIYELQNIFPLVKYISEEAGSLNNYFFNKKYAKKK